MMSKVNPITEQLFNYKIVAILRGVEPSFARQTGEAIIAGGVKFMEITMNTNGAEQMIADWRTAFCKDAFVGAGTVIDLDHAKRAIDAGAQFLISPNLDLDVISYAKQFDVPVYPGVMTPTEILTAWKAGVDAVKLFPMASLGIDYLKEIRGPIKQVPIIATGGVTLNNIDDYFKAGAQAVGMGTQLVSLDAARAGQFAAITKQVNAVVTKTNNFFIS